MPSANQALNYSSFFAFVKGQTYPTGKSKVEFGRALRRGLNLRRAEAQSGQTSPQAAFDGPIPDLRQTPLIKRFGGRPPEVTPAPLLGEHGAEVLAEWLGYDAGKIADLKSNEVVV